MFIYGRRRIEATRTDGRTAETRLPAGAVRAGGSRAAATSNDRRTGHGRTGGGELMLLYRYGRLGGVDATTGRSSVSRLSDVSRTWSPLLTNCRRSVGRGPCAAGSIMSSMWFVVADRSGPPLSTRPAIGASFVRRATYQTCQTRVRVKTTPRACRLIARLPRVYTSRGIFMSGSGIFGRGA